MDPVHWRVRLFTDTFVEINVILIVDIILISKPEGFIVVDSLPFPYFSFYFLFLLAFLFNFQIIWLFFRLLFSSYFFFYLFLLMHVDREINELWISSH